MPIDSFSLRKTALAFAGFKVNDTLAVFPTNIVYECACLDALRIKAESRFFSQRFGNSRVRILECTLRDSVIALYKHIWSVLFMSSINHETDFKGANFRRDSRRSLFTVVLLYPIFDFDT